MAKTEIFMFACDNCGHVVTRLTDQEAKRADCEFCLTGKRKLVTFTAQHEGAVRVKLEIER